MYRNTSETPSKRHQESKKLSPNRDDGKNRPTPNSREAWAEVLATADRYY